MAELRSLGFAGQKTWDKRQRMGFAGATPDYETTSQQENEWGFARLRRQRTTDNGQRNLGFAALRQTTTSTCSL